MELRDELFEGAILAAYHQGGGNRSSKQAREMIRQKRANRDFYRGGDHGGSSHRRPPATTQTASSHSDKGSSSTTQMRSTTGASSSSSVPGQQRRSGVYNKGSMCLKCGGYGHIARDCKNRARVQYGRRYMHHRSSLQSPASSIADIERERERDCAHPNMYDDSWRDSWRFWEFSDFTALYSNMNLCGIRRLPMFLGNLDMCFGKPRTPDSRKLSSECF